MIKRLERFGRKRGHGKARDKREDWTHGETPETVAEISYNSGEMPMAEMKTVKYNIVIQWDAEVGIWFVCESDIPGLTAEAADINTLLTHVYNVAGNLFALNGIPK